MIWVGLGFLFVGIAINCVISDGHLGVYFGTLLACLGVVLIMANHYEKNPSAMDVYQGKTTLDITYRDGVPMDSVVVFKYKEK